jgi:HipA-like protein
LAAHERVLHLYLNEEHIGEIRNKGETNELRLDVDYYDRPNSPLLGQFFEENRRERWRSNVRLTEWFSNLLPEGTLRSLLAEQAGVNETAAHMREIWDQNKQDWPLSHAMIKTIDAHLRTIHLG